MGIGGEPGRNCKPIPLADSAAVTPSAQAAPHNSAVTPDLAFSSLAWPTVSVGMSVIRFLGPGRNIRLTRLRRDDRQSLQHQVRHDLTMRAHRARDHAGIAAGDEQSGLGAGALCRSEEHTSELQSLAYLVCRLLLE